MTGIHNSTEMDAIQYEMYFALERKNLLNRVLGNCSALFVLPFLPTVCQVDLIANRVHQFAGWAFIVLLVLGTYFSGNAEVAVLVAGSILFIQIVVVGLSVRDHFQNHGCEECSEDQLRQLEDRIYENEFKDISRIDLDMATLNQYLVNSKDKDHPLIEFRKFARFVALNQLPDQYFYGLLACWDEDQQKLIRGALVTFDKKSPYLIVDIPELHLPEIEYE